MAGIYQNIPVTISSGNTKSGEIDLVNTASQTIDQHRLAICGLITPGALTSTSLRITPLHPDDDGELVHNDQYGAQVPAITLTIDDHIWLDPTTYMGIDRFKLVAGSSEGADRQFYVVARVL